MEHATCEVTSPAITVIIPVHSRKDYIVQAVSSILQQSLKRNQYEIIVVTNFKDEEIDNFLLSNNCSIIYSDAHYIGEKLCLAIEKSRADILCFLEDDDAFSKVKLEKILRIFEDKEIDSCKNMVTLINADGAMLKAGNSLKSEWQSLRLSNRTMSLNDLQDLLNVDRLWNDVSSFSFRKGSILKHLDSLRRIRGTADIFLFFCSFINDRQFQITSEKLTFYRVHPSYSNSYKSYENWRSNIRNISDIQDNDFGVIANMLQQTCFEKIVVLEWRSIRLYLNILLGIKQHNMEWFISVVKWRRWSLKFRLFLVLGSMSPSILKNSISAIIYLLAKRNFEYLTIHKNSASCVFNE